MNRRGSEADGAAAKKRGGRRKRWTAEKAQEAITAWQQSGLTMAAFCRDRGIEIKRLSWWRKRLATWKVEPEPAGVDVGQGNDRPGWAEAVITGAGDAVPAVVVQLRGGERIEVVSPGQVDAGWLLQLAFGLAGRDRR